MKRLLSIVLLLVAAPLTAQQDVLTIASVAGTPGVVQVPVFLRDTSGTPLGTDRPTGSKLQGLAFRVTFSPASAVSSATFTRGGILGALTPLYETSMQPAGGGSVAYVASFAESNNAIPFTSAPSGDHVGNLAITVANANAPQIVLTIDAATATLSNQTGSVTETVASGRLALVPGLIGVSSPDVRGDLTGDGKADLVWRNGPAGQTMLWALDGFNVTGTTNLPAVGSQWSISGVDDFNGDGRSDLLWRNGATNEIAVWLMNGGAVTTSAVVAVPPSAWVVQGVGDFNGDGRADILLRNGDTNEAIVWLMNGTAVSSAASVAYPSQQWSVQGVGDFNADGRVDIMWRNSATNEAWVWLMNGATIGSTGYVASPPAEWQVKGVADFSGDGRADVLWRNSSTNQVVVWTMSNTSITGTGYLATPPPAWDVRAAADFNGDARADLMWRHGTTGENVIWLLNGTVISSTGNLPTLADQNWTVAGPR